MKAHPVRASSTQKFIEAVVGDDLHAKRILSIANAVLGAVHAAALAIHAIGQALAQARGLNAKHAIWAARVPAPIAQRPGRLHESVLTLARGALRAERAAR
jgi:hypothetical protein